MIKQRHAAKAFSGDGARIHGGRWNSPGRAAVYVSSTKALATLEVLAGLQSTSPLPTYVLIRVSFDESFVRHLDPADLEDGWDRRPPGVTSQALGDGWLFSCESAVLRVPSVIIPSEFNYVLNPAHPKFGKIEIGSPMHFPLDPRLLDR